MRPHLAPWLAAALLAAPARAGLLDDLIALRFERLGNPYIKSDAIPPVAAPRSRPHRLLILPVRFPDVGFDRFKGEKDADRKNRRYLQNLLFSDLSAPRPNTLTHFYWHQSRGRYHVTGTVFPILEMPKPLARYGRPIRNSDGGWRNDAAPEELVEDALRAAVAAQPGFPWADYDVWDPQDYDGDGVRDEPDGYLDHFILVYAGKGQSNCQGLFNLDEKLTANSPADAVERLIPAERDCADRLWPHRFSLTKNVGLGPVVEGRMNARGGVPLREGLWVYDYNMQPEYTELSTFIHEFGHSLGLPDIYARNTDNSTGAWEAMSHTADPYPQELSAWSRMMLGWLKSCVIAPRAAGGAAVQSVYLKTMNDWSPGGAPAGVCDAALVALPPKTRALRLGPLRAGNGRQAAYSGQGNDLRHALSREFDFGAAPSTAALRLELDAWFKIEADWDYLYVQASSDGLHWTRLMPTDKEGPADAASVMPSKKGHDGAGTIPGFTGRSGDLDGDGKVESAPGCDPKKEKALAEDRVGEGREDPCEAAQWVHASFDLSAWRGARARLRFLYYTDMAAVEDGALVDNVAIPALGFKEDFEGDSLRGWSSEGWTLSTGSHTIEVPHFYILEYRDPYARFASAHNYDAAIAEPRLSFLPHPEATGGFFAADFRHRPGVVAWYANGSYLWSENDPSRHGPGQGFLLVVDANPQEYRLPGLESWFKEDGGWSRYELGARDQPALRERFLKTMCLERRPAYVPPSLSEADRNFCPARAPAPIEEVSFRGKPLMYSYTVSNEFLPGPDQDRWQKVGGLFDIKLRQGQLSYRLNDRRLRGAHVADAPFSLDEFRDAIRFYEIAGKKLVLARSRPAAPIARFSDSGRWQNPKLPFGGVAVPDEGLSWELARPRPGAPPGAKVKVYFTWSR